MTADLLADRIAPALAKRSWSLGGRVERECSVFLICDGAAALTRPGQSVTELQAPALVWAPDPARGSLQLAPGGGGYSAAVSDKLLQRVASNPMVSAHRQAFLRRSLVVSADLLGGKLPAITASMQAMTEESRGTGAGSATALGLHLGLLILQVWRVAGLGAAQGRLGETVAQRFVRLVEAHYREGLRIGDYANRLGVSHPHLHECCMTSYGRTPLRLVHERLLEEAKSILRLNEVSVEQVGFALGFRDPGYFNRFFKRETGETPGAYRRHTAFRKTGAQSSFAAWP